MRLVCALLIGLSLVLASERLAANESEAATEKLPVRPLTTIHQIASPEQRSITDRTVDLPNWSQWRRVLRLEDYNTRVVIFSTTMLGLAAGVIGSFTLLRKRALMGDALSHATLPGIGIAFLMAPRFGLDGKSLPVLLCGAAASGLIGIAAILLIRNLTRVKEDAALGIVLSVFFGGGVAILGIVQQTPTGHAAGLEAFIYGKTASIVARDAWLIAGAGIASLFVITVLFKELKLLCFDEGFAGSLGFATIQLDVVLMGLVVLITIVGLQAVGLVLMIALLVIPAASARFWTQEMRQTVLASGILGALSCMIGAGLSAIFPRLPSGAMIVMTSALFFLVSMILGTSRGILLRSLRRYQLNRRIDRRHVLRGIFELLEASGNVNPGKNSKPLEVLFADVLPRRSWSAQRLMQGLRRCAHEGLLTLGDKGRIALTPLGRDEALRLTHEHRLWELYLITYADVAPSRVDRDADAIEHVLEPEMIVELEGLLQQVQRKAGVVASPHVVEPTPIH